LSSRRSLHLKLLSDLGLVGSASCYSLKIDSAIEPIRCAASFEQGATSSFSLSSTVRAFGHSRSPRPFGRLLVRSSLSGLLCSFDIYARSYTFGSAFFVVRLLPLPQPNDP
jgi:hypothetical protein